MNPKAMDARSIIAKLRRNLVPDADEMRWFVGGQQKLMPELLAMVERSGCNDGEFRKLASRLRRAIDQCHFTKSDLPVRFIPPVSSHP